MVKTFKNYTTEELKDSGLVFGNDVYITNGDSRTLVVKILSISIDNDIIF